MKHLIPYLAVLCFFAAASEGWLTTHPVMFWLSFFVSFWGAVKITASLLEARNDARIKLCR